MLCIVILLCHSYRRLMGEKSHYFTFDQIKLLVSKVEIIGVWKKFIPLNFRFLQRDRQSVLWESKSSEKSIYDVWCVLPVRLVMSLGEIHLSMKSISIVGNVTFAACSMFILTWYKTSNYSNMHYWNHKIHIFQKWL